MVYSFRRDPIVIIEHQVIYADWSTFYFYFTYYEIIDEVTDHRTHQQIRLLHTLQTCEALFTVNELELS